MEYMAGDNCLGSVVVSVICSTFLKYTESYFQTLLIISIFVIFFK